MELVVLVAETVRSGRRAAAVPGMSKDKAPVTPAVRVLRAAGIEFTDHLSVATEKE